jgi:hypothetical protein
MEGNIMKRTLLAVTALYLTISLNAISAPPEEGLALWYAFSSDQGSSVKDLSGNGNVGEITDIEDWTNRAEWTGDGKYGGGMNFIDGLIIVPNSQTVTFTDAISICLWIKSEDVPDAYRRLVSCNWANAGGFVLGIDNHWMSMAIAWDIVNVDGTRQDANMNSLIMPGEWQFIAATYDGEMLKVYVNGEMIMENAATGQINTVDDILISYPQLGAEGGSFVGVMDEIRFYNRALDEDEVNLAMEEADITEVSSNNKLSTVWGSIKLLQ